MARYRRPDMLPAGRVEARADFWSVLLEKPAIRGMRDAICDLPDMREGWDISDLALGIGHGPLPLPPPHTHPHDPPVHIIMRLQKDYGLDLQSHVKKRLQVGMQSILTTGLWIWNQSFQKWFSWSLVVRVGSVLTWYVAGWHIPEVYTILRISLFSVGFSWLFVLLFRFSKIRKNNIHFGNARPGAPHALIKTFLHGWSLV